MPVYTYQCLYCDNCDSNLAGPNDKMALCSKCGSLMLRLDDDIFWEFFDKKQFQLTAKEISPLTPTTGDDTIAR